MGLFSAIAILAALAACLGIAAASPLPPRPNAVVFKRSCTECDDVVGSFCEFGYQGAPPGSVACVNYGNDEETGPRRLFGRYGPPPPMTWSFSFNSGQEAGTFRTSGVLSDVSGSFNFAIDVTTLIFTSSVFAPSLAGATFNEGAQPTTGFIWDGNKPLLFYRGGGSDMTGASYFSGTYAVEFAVSGGSAVARITDPSSGATTGFSAMTLTVPSS
ncbi:hypothetical protein DFJ74DRAFT_711228 [Hyaloraphidium curvatum]|nr:hypothetical protein DFJ74DRAFT_711228 [Hyaloraphidium curvatum]